MSVRVALSDAIYPRECLERAVTAYSSVCSVEVCEETSRGRAINIAVAPGADVEEGRAVDEFLNYLLDLSLEARFASHDGGGPR